DALGPVRRLRRRDGQSGEGLEVLLGLVSRLDLLVQVLDLRGLGADVGNLLRCNVPILGLRLSFDVFRCLAVGCALLPEVHDEPPSPSSERASSDSAARARADGLTLSSSPALAPLGSSAGLASV